MTQYPQTIDAWRRLPVERTDNRLEIGGWHVMDTWEEPLMEVMAREVTQRKGDVLEVGFGMGISAQKILGYGCSSYTVIEVHPVIAAQARRWGREQAVDVTVLEGAWQDIVPGFDRRFDGVLFDTYPLSAQERHRNHFPFIPLAPGLLRDEGVLVYYSDETVDFRPEHLRLILTHFNDVKLARVDGLQPVANCDYWQETHMIVPVARNVGP